MAKKEKKPYNYDEKIYMVDFVLLNYRDDTIVLTFSQHLPGDEEIVIARVSMSPQFYKYHFLEAIKRVLEDYERQFGEIKPPK